MTRLGLFSRLTAAHLHKAGKLLSYTAKVMTFDKSSDGVEEKLENISCAGSRRIKAEIKSGYFLKYRRY
jgi:hypothetical protein